MFYKPITPHDRTCSIALMVAGPTIITLLETSDSGTDTPQQANTKKFNSDLWYLLLLIIAFLLSCSGLALLLLNYQHSGRRVGKPFTIICEIGSGALGLAIFVRGNGGLVPLASGLWAWALVAGGIVARDRRDCATEEQRGHHDTIQC
ncbi:hypothetical protein Q7P37_004560 [Cladosporium fusiforme]